MRDPNRNKIATWPIENRVASYHDSIGEAQTRYWICILRAHWGDENTDAWLRNLPEPADWDEFRRIVRAKLVEIENGSSS